MRSFIVVHPCPRICIFPYVRQAVKHIAIQYVLSESSVKPFYQTILCRLAWLYKLPLYVVLLTPPTHGLSDKLWAVVRTDLLRFASPFQQFLQFPDYPLCGQTGIHCNGKCLPTEIVYDVQCTYRFSAGQRVVHEIKAPGDVRSDRTE